MSRTASRSTTGGGSSRSPLRGAEETPQRRRRERAREALGIDPALVDHRIESIVARELRRHRSGGPIGLVGIPQMDPQQERLLRAALEPGDGLVGRGRALHLVAERLLEHVEAGGHAGHALDRSGAHERGRGVAVVAQQLRRRAQLALAGAERRAAPAVLGDAVLVRVDAGEQRNVRRQAWSPWSRRRARTERPRPPARRGGARSRDGSRRRARDRRAACRW